MYCSLQQHTANARDTLNLFINYDFAAKRDKQACDWLPYNEVFGRNGEPQREKLTQRTYLRLFYFKQVYFLLRPAR